MMVNPDKVDLTTLLRRKNTGRVMEEPCFQYHEPCPSRVPLPLTVRLVPVSRISGPSHF